MVKLICPHCMKPVPVPDDFTGSQVTCPHCMKSFDAPARYNPEVIPESPPLAPAATPPTPPPIPTRPSEPSMSPEVPPVPMPVTLPAAPPPAPPGLVYPPTPVAHDSPQSSAGYTHSVGFAISPQVVGWLPAVLLTVAFLCTFFPWVGSYIGGYPVYSQNIWRAMFGSVGRNFSLEANMPGSTAWLDNVPADWVLLVPYVLLLVLAAGVAWAGHGLRGINPQNFPPIAKIWPWRKTLVAVLGGLAFVLIVSQVINGFGMERAIRKMVREGPELSKAREEAQGSSAKLAAVENREDAELAKYNIARTWWQDLALMCNFVAVLAVLLSIALDRRGNKPPPKLLLHY